MKSNNLLSNIDLLDLQHCRGALAETLRLVNVSLLHNKSTSKEASEAMATLLALIVDREAGLKLFKALGSLSWPGTYGQSPWDEVYSVLSAAIQGHPVSKYHGQLARILQSDLVERVALPSAKYRLALDEAGRSKRYPRLLEAMRHGAMLTHGEADAALRMLLRACPCERGNTIASSEAVANFGGNLRVVHQARRWRKMFPERVTKAAHCRMPDLVHC